jgi:hypothetical protein
MTFLFLALVLGSYFELELRSCPGRLEPLSCFRCRFAALVNLLPLVV